MNDMNESKLSTQGSRCFEYIRVVDNKKDYRSH